MGGGELRLDCCMYQNTTQYEKRSHQRTIRYSSTYIAERGWFFTLPTAAGTKYHHIIIFSTIYHIYHTSVSCEFAAPSPFHLPPPQPTPSVSFVYFCWHASNVVILIASSYRITLPYISCIVQSYISSRYMSPPFSKTKNASLRVRRRLVFPTRLRHAHTQDTSTRVEENMRSEVCARSLHYLDHCLPPSRPLPASLIYGHGGTHPLRVAWFPQNNTRNL